MGDFFDIPLPSVNKGEWLSYLFEFLISAHYIFIGRSGRGLQKFGDSFSDNYFEFSFVFLSFCLFSLALIWVSMTIISDSESNKIQNRIRIISLYVIINYFIISAVKIYVVNFEPANQKLYFHFYVYVILFFSTCFVLFIVVRFIYAIIYDFIIQKNINKNSEYVTYTDEILRSRQKFKVTNRDISSLVSSGGKPELSLGISTKKIKEPAVRMLPKRCE